MQQSCIKKKTNLQQSSTPPQKWFGSVCANLPGTEPDRSWSLLGDYLSLHKFLPAILSCELVSNSNGKLGCVRLLHVVMTRTDDQTGSVVGWVKNKLVAIDPVGRSYSYDAMENTIGYDTYSATLRVVERDNEGCKIEWLYEADPVVGWTDPEFLGFIQARVEKMARRVAEALVHNAH